MEKLFKIGQEIVKYIAIFFLIYLSVTSILTYIYDAEWMEVYATSHNIFINVAGLGLFAIAYGLLVWLRTKYPLTDKTWNKIYGAILLVIFMLTIIQLPMPRADLANMMKAIFEMQEGDYSYLDDGYFKVWPQMLPMVALFKMFGPIPFVFYIFNFILLLIMFSTLMRTTNNNKYLASGLVLCLPILQYTCVYYGEFIAIFAITLSICYLKNILSSKATKGDYIGLFIVSFFGYLYKQNFLIFILAEILTIILFVIKERNKKFLKSFMLIMIAAILVNPFQHMFTKLMIGKEYTSQNNISWIAMGMHEPGEKYFGSQINGGYDGFNAEVVYLNKYDKDKIKEESIKDIKNSLNRFKENGIGYTLGFYHDKLSKQWTTPDWSINHYLKMTRADNVMNQTKEQLAVGESWHPKDHDWKQYITTYDQILDVFNKGMMICVYVGVLYWLFKKKTGSLTFNEVVLLALFIGNFMFSIIWEAKPRYNIYGYYGLVLLFFLNVENILIALKGKFKK